MNALGLSKKIESSLRLSSLSPGNSFYALSDDLILSYLPGMKRKGAHEWAGPCPHCGGEDRFIWRTDNGRQRAFCRQCRWSGDAIQLLMDFARLTFPEALRVLGMPERGGRMNPYPTRHAAGTRSACPKDVPPVSPQPAPPTLPCEKWTNSAARLVSECQANLMTPNGYEFLGQRFLTEGTARHLKFGWNPTDRYERRQDWGLEPYSDANGKFHDKMIVPKGAILPIQRKGHIVALLVRCADDRPAKRPRYWEVIGGARGLAFTAGEHGRPVVLVESLLDAALLWQEGRGEFAAVATCGSSKPPDADADHFIRRANALLACPDSDDGGRTAWAQWSAAYPGAIYVPPLHGKDLTEMHAAALAWPINEAIPTVGGWLTAALSIARETAQVCPVSHDNAEREPNCGANRKTTAKAA